MAAAKPSLSPPATEVWTTRKLLKWMMDFFTEKQIDSPRVAAEMLLAHVLGCERLRLYMEVDRPASPVELSTLRLLVARAARHEPVQYLVGHAWFLGRQFEVNRSTLIPRPCTETLVEHVLQWHKLNPGHAAPLIADIGTGTGCIAISLAAYISDVRVIATDISQAALDLAAANAVRHDVSDRIEFRRGDGLEPLHAGPPGQRFDIICSNPPYIPDHEWGDVAPNVKEHEPEQALRGGADGLDVVRPIIAEAAAIMRAGGLLAIEIAHASRQPALDLLNATDQFENTTVLKDHEDLWRVLVANRREN